MKRISEITRRDIIEVIINGFTYFDEDEWPWNPEEKRAVMPYYGRLDEVAFLKRLYRLDELPSHDSRYKNASGDISCHVKFGDYDNGWIFCDERFCLSNADEDEPLLRLMCEMLHPVVRDERGPWKKYLDKFNELLNCDGYELYPSQTVSGRSIYAFREKIDYHFSYTSLFTERYKEYIVTEGVFKDRISSSVDYNVKKRLSNVMLDFAEPQQKHPNRYDNWTENTDAFQEAVARLNEYVGYPAVDLVLMNGVYSQFELLANCFTPFLFDVIELQYDELSSAEKEDFKTKINDVFSCSRSRFILSERGLIEQIIEYAVLTPEIIAEVKKIQEPGIKELVEEAIKRHAESTAASQKESVEKMWDAFERVKTIHTEMNKRDSAEKLICSISGETKGFDELLRAEFKALTEIGNEYRIRHHETDKKEINDLRLYDYLFNRCLAVVALAIGFIQ